MKKVAIVGAGISGLYLANELNKNTEIDYKIFEKKDYLNLNEGYGIQLSVNSINLLNKIGFKNISASDVYYPTKVNFFQANNIKKICEIDLKQFNNVNDRYTTLKRSTLIKFLIGNIPEEKIQFKADIQNIEYNEKIKISWNNKNESFDYIVIADGVFSKLKSQISNNHLNPIFNGNIALRANLKQHEKDNISVYIGSNFHYVTYPVNQKLEYNFVAIIKKKLTTKEIEDKNILNSETFIKTLKDLISKNSIINLENLVNLKCFPVFVSTELPSLKYQNTFLSGDALFAEGTGTFKSGSIGNLTVSDALFVAQDIIHSGDTDTKITLAADDLTVTVGNEQMIKITEDGSQDKIVFGDGGDIDYEFSGTGEFKFTTDNTDHAITQHDGNEVARIHDGGATQSDNDMTSVGYGFGFKSPVMSVTADSGDATVSLSADDSGAIIQCDADTNNITFVLPTIDAANKAGLTYTFVNTTAVNGSKTIKIRTGGGAADDADKFLLYGFNGATSITDVAGDILTIPNSAAIGTVVRITCLTSGASNAAELWLAEVFGASAVTNTAS